MHNHGILPIKLRFQVAGVRKQSFMSGNCYTIILNKPVEGVSRIYIHVRMYRIPRKFKRCTIIPSVLLNSAAESAVFGNDKCLIAGQHLPKTISLTPLGKRLRRPITFRSVLLTGQTLTCSTFQMPDRAQTCFTFRVPAHVPQLFLPLYRPSTILLPCIPACRMFG